MTTPTNLAEKILWTQRRRVVAVEVPAWGFSVYLRAWSPAELQSYQTWIKDHSDKALEVYALTAQMSLCDEDGKLLFSEDAILDLMTKDISALTLIAEEVLKLNGLRSADRDSFRPAAPQ